VSALIRHLRPLVGWLVDRSSSRRQQVASGVVWLAAGDGLGAILGFVKLAIIARLLAPADFGLFAIALLTTSMLEYLTELSFRDALIRHRDDVAPYIDTVWTAQILRGAAIAAVIAASTPFVARYYDVPLAMVALPLLAVEVMVRSVANPATVYLRKNLDLMRDILWRLAGPIAGLIAGVTLAVLLRNALALFVSVLVASTAQTLASYWIRPYRPRLALDARPGRELVGFGYRCFWLRVVGLVNWYADTLVVTRLLGLTVTGQYQMAGRLATAAGVAIGGPLHGVMFPAFSGLPGVEHHRDALRRTLAVVLSVTLPLALGVSIFSPLIIGVLLGPGWAEVPALLSVLAWLTVTLPAGHVLNALFMALDRVGLDIWATATRAAILVALIYPAVTTYGALGAAAVTTASAVVGLLCQLLLASRLVGLRPSELLPCLRGGLLASLPLVVVWISMGSAVSAGGIVTAVFVGTLSAVIGLSSAWKIFTTGSAVLPLEGVK
jgi:O-antigen/teichoic acid export membrane protein